MNRFSLGVLLTGFACMAVGGTETFVDECEKGVNLGIVTLVGQQRIPSHDLVVTRHLIAAECEKVTPEDVAKILELSAWISTEQFGANLVSRHFKLPEGELEAYRAGVVNTKRERVQSTNQELVRYLESLEVQARTKLRAESEQRELRVVERFAQMCEHGFEIGLKAIKATGVPTEEERAAHNSVCKNFYADATERSQFDAKYTDEMERDAAACAIGTLVLFTVRNTETSNDIFASAAVQCATLVTTPASEDIEKGTR